MSTLQTSSEYHRFLLPVIQRPLNQPKLDAIRSSMKARSARGDEAFDRTEPIAVRREGRFYRIVRGQHRFAAAREEGVHVVFIIDDSMTDESAVSLYRTTWTSQDVLTAMVQKGDPNYKYLQEFISRHGVPIATAYALLGGNTACFSDMTFEPKTIEFAELVMEIVAVAKRSAPFATQGSFVRAISNILKVPAVDPEVLRRKIMQYGVKLRPCTNVIEYANNIEEIYNFRTDRCSVVNIGFLVKERIRSERTQNLAKHISAEVRGRAGARASATKMAKRLMKA